MPVATPKRMDGHDELRRTFASLGDHWERGVTSARTRHGKARQAISFERSRIDNEVGGGLRHQRVEIIHVLDDEDAVIGATLIDRDVLFRLLCASRVDADQSNLLLYKKSDQVIGQFGAAAPISKTFEAELFQIAVWNITVSPSEISADATSEIRPLDRACPRRQSVFPWSENFRSERPCP